MDLVIENQFFAGLFENWGSHVANHLPTVAGIRARGTEPAATTQYVAEQLS
jgi:hypothetical protein